MELKSIENWVEKLYELKKTKDETQTCMIKFPPEAFNTISLIFGADVSLKNGFIESLLSLGKDYTKRLSERRSELRKSSFLDLIRCEIILRGRPDVDNVFDEATVFEITEHKELLQVALPLQLFSQIYHFEQFNQIIAIDLKSPDIAINELVFFLEYLNSHQFPGETGNQTLQQSSSTPSGFYSFRTWPPNPPKIIVVGLNYLEFQKLEGIIRKNVCKSIRWISLLYKVKFICFGDSSEISTKVDNSRERLISFMSCLLFPIQKGSNFHINLKFKDVSHDKPLLVDCMEDDYFSIRLPWIKSSVEDAVQEETLEFKSLPRKEQVRRWSEYLRIELKAYKDLQSVETLETTPSPKLNKLSKVPFPNSNYAAEEELDTFLVSELLKLQQQQS